ncbi:MAG: ABC transporter permease [Acidobacteria bacterium]|nr:ABC transporter permease [Acidobacteriota bacterium]
MRSAVRQAVFILWLVAVWQTLYESKLWPPYMFPSVPDVLQSLRAGIADRTYIVGVGTSMKRILAGYGLSAFLGVLTGLLIARSRFLKDSLGGLVLGLQSLPSLCWLPLAVLWFGLTEKAILFVVVMGSLLSVTINTEAGVRNIPKIYFLAGQNLGAHGLRLFLHVLLPASLPQLLAGLKQGWAFAWRSLVAAEMLFVSLGLGHLLMMGRDLNDISQVLAIMILIMGIGYLTETLIFGIVENRVRQRWGLASGG